MISLRLGVFIAVVFALVAPGSAWARDVEVVVRLDSPESPRRTPGVACSARRRSISASTSGADEPLVPSTPSRSRDALRGRLAREVLARSCTAAIASPSDGLAVVLPARGSRSSRGSGGLPQHDVPGRARPQRRDDRSDLVLARAGRRRRIRMKMRSSTTGSTSRTPSSPLPRSRCLRASEGADRVHDEEGDRRARVPAARADLEESQPAVRPVHSSHATHVSGIAAGNAGTLAGSVRISGVAPRAYLGNYKVLTVPPRASGSTATPPRSRLVSKPLSPTAWT